jgi:hypothetical protein
MGLKKKKDKKRRPKTKEPQQAATKQSVENREKDSSRNAGKLLWQGVVVVVTLLGLISIYYHLNPLTISATQVTVNPENPLLYLFTIKNSANRSSQTEEARLADIFHVAIAAEDLPKRSLRRKVSTIRKFFNRIILSLKSL